MSVVCKNSTSDYGDVSLVRCPVSVFYSIWMFKQFVMKAGSVFSFSVCLEMTDSSSLRMIYADTLLSIAMIRITGLNWPPHQA